MAVRKLVQAKKLAVSRNKLMQTAVQLLKGRTRFKQQSNQRIDGNSQQGLLRPIYGKMKGLPLRIGRGHQHNDHGHDGGHVEKIAVGAAAGHKRHHDGEVNGKSQEQGKALLWKKHEQQQGDSRTHERPQRAQKPFLQRLTDGRQTDNEYGERGPERFVQIPVKGQRIGADQGQSRDQGIMQTGSESFGHGRNRALKGEAENKAPCIVQPR